MTIEITQLSKYFEEGKPIIDNLTLHIKEKLFSGFLGPSGCGKTTLLRMIAGLEKPNQGKIAISGETLVDCQNKIFVNPEKRNIAMVFQSYAVWPHMSVFENIAFPLQIKKLPKTQIREQVLEAIELVQLSGLQDRYSNQLSGGQQQRIALARAIVQKPRLLVLDEPLSNLDAVLRGSMRRELRELQQKLGISAILVTHDWADAESLCDEICVFNQGHVVQQGSPISLLNNPANAFVEKMTHQH